jgi:hypothetical protein
LTPAKGQKVGIGEKVRNERRNAAALDVYDVAPPGS